MPDRGQRYHDRAGTTWPRAFIQAREIASWTLTSDPPAREQELTTGVKLVLGRSEGEDRQLRRAPEAGREADGPDAARDVERRERIAVPSRDEPAAARGCVRRVERQPDLAAVGMAPKDGPRGGETAAPHPPDRPGGVR